ncbi:universal stress protein [Pseudomonas sp. Marseille-QA0892]
MINILVATDLSERSNPAIDRAARLVRSLGGRWALVHVVDNDAPAELTARHVEHAKTLLKASAERLGSQHGTEPEIIVISGDVEPTILKAAHQFGADLLVVGAHRKSALRDFFLGTTVERVIRSSRLPVLRVARPALQDYARSLVAIDLSPVSLDALRTACRLGVLQEQEFDVVHAAELVPIGAMAEVVPDPRLVDEMLAEARRKAKAQLAQIEPAVPEQRLYVREGEPRRVIGDQLQFTNADLLVVGTHARSGVQRLMIGSVASSLLASLDCDILTVPPAEPH